MDAQEIVKKYLDDNGFDGLYNTDAECACQNDDLCPCCETFTTCEAGYLFGCTCGEHDFHIGSADAKKEWEKEHPEEGGA